MRYERDDSMGKASNIIRARIAALPEFSEARESVILAAIGECHGKDVPAMRALGGFSEVIRRHIDALPGKYRGNHGSAMIPYTICRLLREDTEALREAVQRACCEREADRKILLDNAGTCI